MSYLGCIIGPVYLLSSIKIRHMMHHVITNKELNDYKHVTFTNHCHRNVIYIYSYILKYGKSWQFIAPHDWCMNFIATYSCGLSTCTYVMYKMNKVMSDIIFGKYIL